VGVPLTVVDVSAQTIRQVEFREKLRGYHQDDVDEFLERVAAGIEILQERLRQATERAVRAEQAATGSREDDESLRRTLVLAQRTADLAVKEAKEQAARVIEEAEGEASGMLAAAGEERRRMAEEAEAQVRNDVARLEAARLQLEQDVDRLVRYLDEQRARVKAALAEASRGLDTALSAQPAPAQAGEADLGQVHDGEPGPGYGAGTYDPSGQGGHPYS
jgi:cell division initiation protein